MDLPNSLVLRILKRMSGQAFKNDYQRVLIETFKDVAYLNNQHLYWCKSVSFVSRKESHEEESEYEIFVLETYVSCPLLSEAVLKSRMSQSTAQT